MAIVAPYVLQSNTYAAQPFRQELQAGLPFGSAGGIIPATWSSGKALATDLAVLNPVSGMSVLINPGQAYVTGSLGSGSGYGQGTGYGAQQIATNGSSPPTVSTYATAVQLTTQGTYWLFNDNSAGQDSLSVASSNPTNPRIDVVGMQVEDAQYAGSNNDWKLVVVTGTAAASPAVPSLPATFMPLAYLWISANLSNIGSGNIFDVRCHYNRNPYRAEMYRNASYTQSASGLVPVPYDTVIEDPTEMTTPGSGEFTAPIGGLYFLTATWGFTPAAAGGRYQTVTTIGGVGYVLQGQIPDGTGAMNMTGGRPFLLAAGATVVVEAQTPATNIVFAVGITATSAQMVLLSPA